MSPATRLKRTFGIIAGLTIIISSIGCKNNCESHYNVSQESKDYGYFLKGSYWVYQNDSTFEVDSFNIIGAATGVEIHSLVEEGCNPHYYYLGVAKSVATSNISGDILEYFCGTKGGVVFNKNSEFLGIYFISASQTPNTDSLLEIIESLDLNGKNFSNVYESTYHTGANIYFAKNIGVIKTEILNDTSGYVESWSLLRYNIIQ